MASRAHERAQRILGNPTEAQLAELIMHDVSALTGNAGGKYFSFAISIFDRTIFSMSRIKNDCSMQIKACWLMQESQCTERGQTSGFSRAQ